MKRKETREKISWYLQINKSNIRFIHLNIVFVTIIVISLVLAIYDQKHSLVAWNSDSIGVLSQVITAIVAFIISTIGIAITLQREECWGVSIKEFNKLRAGLRYPIVLTIVIAVLLSASNVAFYVIDFVFATIGLSVVAISFCIYVVMCEIPLMVKSESFLTKIIKTRLLREWKSTKDLPKELKEVLKYLLINNNLKNTYQKFKSSNNEYNKFLILKLLELLNDVASDLIHVESLQVRIKYADSILVSVRNVIYYDVDLSEIIGSDFSSYYYYVTHILFNLNKIPDCTEKVSSLVSTMLSGLQYSGLTEEKIKFNMQIILTMVTITIRNGDFTFVKKLRERFSIEYYNLGHDNYDTLVFALVSMQMYFLCNDSQNATEELKSDVKNFISQSETINYTDISSWKNLYKVFSREFNLDFEKFMYYFRTSESNWDVPKYYKMQLVNLDQPYATYWFVTHLLNSHRINDYDLSSLCLNEFCKHSLKSIGEKCFDDEGNFTISSEMQSILDFYDVGKYPMQFFLIVEKNTHRLFHFINKIKKDDLLAESSLAEKTNNEDISTEYKTAVLSAIKSEWGYDLNVPITSNDRSLSVLIEKTSRAINYKEVMCQALVESIFNEIRNNTPIKTVVTNETELEEVICDKIAYITYSTKFLQYSLKKPSIKKLFEYVCEQANVIESHIFYKDILAKENSFSFNVELTKFNVRNLSLEEISEEVERYKRADGQYVYEGVFFSREEIESFVKTKYAVLDVSIKYQIVCRADGIIIIELD